MGIRSYYALSDPTWRRYLRWGAISVAIAVLTCVCAFAWVANTFASAIVWAASVPL